MNITAFDLAQRFIGTAEVRGASSNPQVLAMLRLDQPWPETDAVPWCSAYVNYIAWLLRLPRSKNLRARSWLQVGRPILLAEAKPAWDVVILDRASGQGASVLEAPGHVGFFAGMDRVANQPKADRILVLGGNQADSVSVSPFPTLDVLGLRRLYEG